MFELDGASGVLRWRYRSERSDGWNTRFCGTVAGGPNSHGYICVEINNVSYKVHRIIRKMLHGDEPEHTDHQNCAPWDNTPSNLRAASQSENNRNRRRNSGKSLPKGVSFYKWGRGCLRVGIMYGGKNRHVGYFDDVEAAHAAYREKALIHHGEFARID